ncbi:hypothetical protein JOB18_028609 [Solea senegalensis]|uniref:Uncharacterized protein n=1 Tax=Solea senegalensis TaxID=28829 RepID=A0AAV6RFZ3_SOLSE|nr:hypothetical protein JOB18_028609 [Solea senegalensis]
MSSNQSAMDPVDTGVKKRKRCQVCPTRGDSKTSTSCVKSPTILTEEKRELKENGKDLWIQVFVTLVSIRSWATTDFP